MICRGNAEEDHLQGVREAMLRKADNGGQTVTAAERIVPLDRARTFITLLVVLYHSVLNFTVFGNGDRMRWLGFDLVALFNDSFFMACMFFISGLFVRDSLARRRPANFFHFWWHTLTIGPWPAGSAWFLWVLLALGTIAALLWAAAPRAIEGLGQLIYALRDRPMTAFAAFLIFSIIIYLPMRLMFGDSSWLEPGHYPLVIQTSRILLYAGYFLAGVGVGAVSLRSGMLAQHGALAKRWTVWLAFALAFYGAILLLVYTHHNWLADFNSPPLWWHVAYGLAFAMFSAAMTFTVPAVLLRFARSSHWLLDAMQPSAYGIYLLHFIFLIGLQYVVYDPPFPAFVKFAIVFTGTLSMSWALTALLRQVPIVARTI
jgi:hypothetical protein